MARKKLLEAADDLLKKSLASAYRDEKKGLKDPDMDDHGEAVDEPEDDLPDYAKSVKKDTSAPTKNMQKVTEEDDEEEDDEEEMNEEDDEEENEDDDEMNEEEDEGEEGDDEEEDEEEMNEEDDEGEGDEEDDEKKEKVEESFSFASLLNKRTKIDVSKEVNRLFEGGDFSEEFKEKAATLFESAVRMKVKEVSKQIAESADKIFAKEIRKVENQLSESVDDFLKVVLGEWLEQNEVAIESRLKTQIAEDFMRGMRDLFVEHYIEVPEDKTDLFEELTQKVDALEDNLNETIAQKIEISKYIVELENKIAFNEVVRKNNLTLTQEQKLSQLAEDYSDIRDKKKYIGKINTLIENYILNEDTSTSKNGRVSLTESIADSTETVVEDAAIKQLAKTLSKRKF